MTHRTGLRSRRGWIIAAATVLVLAGAAVAADRFLVVADPDTTGVSSTRIVLGSHQPLSGPAAPGYAEISAAAAAFFRYVNAHGGVYGRSIVFDYRDDAYNPVDTLRTTRDLVDKTQVFAMTGGLGTATHQAVVRYLNDSKVPDLFVETGCTCFNRPGNYPYTYGYFPNYKVEGKILGQYVRANFPAARIAYLYQDDDLGQNSQDGLNQIIPTTQVATRQSYDLSGLANGLGEQVAAAKAAGANVLVIFGIPTATAQALLAAAQLHYHPTVVVSNVSADPSTLIGLLTRFSGSPASAALANGIITDSYLPSPTDPTNPWIRLFHLVHDTYERGQPFDANVVNGMGLAYLTYQALHAAGPNLTRQGLLNALSTRGTTFLGPNLAPYGFTPTDHNGMRGTQVGTMSNGQLVLAGPVFVTDDQDAPVDTYSGPHPEPPTTF